MNVRTQRRSIAGPAGSIECAIDAPAGEPRAVAVVCHPHPQHGGTMDNKVVQTLARAFVQLGLQAVRFNFRGVGASQGAWAEGVGEVDDARAVVDALASDGAPPVLAGFSFGGYVAARVAADLAAAGRPCERLVLVAPAVSRFPTPPAPLGSLVLHGEADDVVPLAAVLDWARPQAQPVTVIPGAGHFFHGQLSLLKSLVVGAWPR
jgi:hypothetical protein